MKLTIIPSDGAVYKDSYSFSELALTGVPANVSALQWDTNAGWIEFLNESEFRRPPNETIAELPEWALGALAKWEEAKAAEDSALAQAVTQPATTGAETL